MSTVKVDPARRIRLRILTPGDLYEPEIRSADEITLRRVTGWRPVKLTKKEALKAIEKSPLRFTAHWEQLREETRR